MSSAAAAVRRIEEKEEGARKKSSVQYVCAQSEVVKFRNLSNVCFFHVHVSRVHVLDIVMPLRFRVDIEGSFFISRRREQELVRG